MTGWRCRRGILTRGSESKDRRATAAHEAAHAVVGHRMGERILEVRLVRQKTRFGYTRIEYGSRNGRLDPLTRAVIALAGHEAEVRFYGRPIKLLPVGDAQTVIRMGYSSKSFNTVGWMARQHVRWFERDIRRVQRALLRHGRLNRRQFLAALRVA